MSVSTDVTRGLLGETGMSYNLVLNRSFDWPAYELMLESGFNFNGVSVQLMLGALQMAWDRVCLLYTSPSPRDRTRSRMPSSALKKKQNHHIP